MSEKIKSSEQAKNEILSMIQEGSALLLALTPEAKNVIGIHYGHDDNQHPDQRRMAVLILVDGGDQTAQDRMYDQALKWVQRAPKPTIGDILRAGGCDLEEISK